MIQLFHHHHNLHLISDENRKILRLFNGNIQIFDKSQNKISEIAFDTYDLDLMPYSFRILLENLVRNYDEKIVDENLIKKFIFNKNDKFEIPLGPQELFFKTSPASLA